MNLSDEEWALLDYLYPLCEQDPSAQFRTSKVMSDERAKECAAARRLRDKGLVEGTVSADDSEYALRLSTYGHELMRQIQNRDEAEVVAGGLLIYLSGAPRGHSSSGQELLPMVRKNLGIDVDDEELPHIISDAVQILEDLDCVSVRRTLGTRPFRFAYVSASHRTREAANNYRSTRRLVGGFGSVPPQVLQTIGNQLVVHGTGHQIAGNILSPNAHVGDVFQERASQIGAVPPQLRELSSVLDTINSTLESQREQLMEIEEHQLGTHELLAALFKRLAELDDDLLEVAKSSPDGEFQALAKVEEFIDKMDLDRSMPLFRKLLDEHGAPTLRTFLIAIFVKYGLPAAAVLL